eukprot:4648944-Pleurochrysis_carterae.AAC.2
MRDSDIWIIELDCRVSNLDVAVAHVIPRLVEVGGKLDVLSHLLVHFADEQVRAVGELVCLFGRIDECARDAVDGEEQLALPRRRDQQRLAPVGHVKGVAVPARASAAWRRDSRKRRARR